MAQKWKAKSLVWVSALVVVHCPSKPTGRNLRVRALGEPRVAPVLPGGRVQLWLDFVTPPSPSRGITESDLANAFQITVEAAPYTLASAHSRKGEAHVDKHVRLWTRCSR